MPWANASPSTQASALLRLTPTARSFMTPTRMPAARAADCASRSWLSATHCSQTKKSISRAYWAAKVATSGELGRRYSVGHSRQFRPKRLTSTHQVANWVSVRPSPRTKLSFAIMRTSDSPSS